MSNLTKNLTNTVLAIGLLCTFKSNAQQGVVSIQQDPKIDMLLKERKHLLASGKIKTHFSIQVISGELETAKQTLKNCKIKFPKLKSNIFHEKPNYKVWIGEFRNRLDADSALLQISKEFEGAFVLKPQNK
jgi:hypothetical protein